MRKFGYLLLNHDPLQLRDFFKLYFHASETEGIKLVTYINVYQ